jgi:serine/threonine protein kinase
MVGSDLSGLTVGEYKLLEKIGEGGYGAVYRCEQLSLDRKVVVKVLLQLWSNEAQQRFLQEAKLASRLRSTYAATIFTAGVTQDGIAWIAMG